MFSSIPVMDDDFSEKQPLFGDDVESKDDSKTLNTLSHQNLRVRSSAVLMILLTMSLILNIVLLNTALYPRPQRFSCRSEYTGLDYSQKSTYHIYTDFIHPNRSISDALWESLDSSPIMVALDQQYVAEHNLKPSIPFPWDKSKGLYHIKAFHHIHCLKNIRRAYLDAIYGSEAPIPITHILHCLDTIRQDLMCHADDTPMPTIDRLHKIGDGQERKCKDWNVLVAWTQAPERQACFKMIDEYRRVPNSLEEFAFCPEGSAHMDVMKAYFEKWGHRDPFGDS